jgi:hypothetical protein
MQVIVNATASADGLSSLIQAAERMKGMDQRREPVFAPVLFILNETVSHADKMLLAFNALVLSSVQGALPLVGKIVHGMRASPEAPTQEKGQVLNPFVEKKRIFWVNIGLTCVRRLPTFPRGICCSRKPISWRDYRWLKIR